MEKHSNKTACVSKRKEWATVDLYGPNALGYTRHTMAKPKGFDPERVR